MNEPTPSPTAGSADEPGAAAWNALRTRTAARIALERSGGSLTTAPTLAFQLAHARARDAVHAPFDAEAIASAVTARGWRSIRVHSRAPDRTAFLQRPDRGRRLDDASCAALDAARGDPLDAVFVIADGLSTRAIAANAMPVLALARATLSDWGWSIGPVVIAEQSRVALADEIGERLAARTVVILIGERPGLSAADSLGLYLTFDPRVGRTDAERNCISNVRAGGQTHAEAVHRLLWLMREARARGFTGTALKDASEGIPSLIVAPAPAERLIPANPSG